MGVLAREMEYYKKMVVLIVSKTAILAHFKHPSALTWLENWNKKRFMARKMEYKKVN